MPFDERARYAAAAKVTGRTLSGLVRLLLREWLGKTAEATPEVTVSTVRASVASVDEVKSDYAMAHSLESDLHLEVLRAIAEGRCAEPAAVAKEALATRAIEFARHCA